MSKVPLTVAGAEKMRDELTRLKGEDRPRIIAAIAEARAHGDLKENAEYHAAKEQQSFVEGRIKDLEGKLSNAQVIDVTAMGSPDKVIFGATLRLFDVDADAEIQYKIVGDDEADISAGLISISSPIARALIGKAQDDEVVVQAPGGEKIYEVIQIQYI
jgi:transcription elongation factor GreA